LTSGFTTDYYLGISTVLKRNRPGWSEHAVGPKNFRFLAQK